MVRGIASAEEVGSWNRWIESSDENRMKVNRATSDLAGFMFRSPEMPDIEKQWSKVYSQTIGRAGHRMNRSLKKNDAPLRWLLRAVAIILVVGFSGLGTYYFYETEAPMPQLEQLSEARTITTEQGEQKTMRFSNGAKVILNSNSSLTYTLGLLHSQTIEVTLEGEAWFETAEGFSGEQPAFAIRTPDGIIRDIGTKFLVTIREKKSRVVMQEGIVEVEPVRNYANGSQGNMATFRIQKGEMVEFNRNNVLAREQINPTLYTSWATGFMEFDKTGLEEFSQYVRDQFGVYVQLNDTGLTDITLDGTVYFRSLDELVRSVSEVTGIPVYRSADKQTVYIGSIE